MSKYILIHLNHGEPNLYAENTASVKAERGKLVIVKFIKDGTIYEDNAEVIEETDNKIDSVSDIDRIETLRELTPHDFQILETHKLASKEAMNDSIDLSRKHNLDMKIIGAKISHDNKMLTLIFTAEERVDFRDLLKDLAKKFKRQIRLRQIGPRDHASLLGGYGKCGRKQCCSSFLTNLGGITMEMARVQDITSKGASKISGNCGKLLCCLSYEFEVYRDLREKMPRPGQIVDTPDGKGTVVDLEVLKQMVKVQFHATRKTRHKKDEVESIEEFYNFFPLEKVKVIDKKD